MFYCFFSTRIIMVASICFLLLISSIALPQVADKVVLADGQVLNGEVLNETIRFNTIYGNIDVPKSAIARFERLSDSLEKIFTANGERISGFLVSEIRFQIGDVTNLALSKDIIERIVLAEPQQIETVSFDYFQMKNGDQFYGEVVDKSFEFRTSYGTMDTAYTSVVRLEDVQGQTRMQLGDGSSVVGYLNTPKINVTSMYGYSYRIPKSNFKVIQFR